MVEKKVLLTTLVRNRAWCLEKVLENWLNLNYPKSLMEIFFQTHNNNDSTLSILRSFQESYKNIYSKITLMEYNFPSIDPKEHYWPKRKIDCLRAMRNRYLAEIKDNDYIFAVDSDIILDPSTLKYLLSLNKDIVSPVFWATWGNSVQVPLPNVWSSGNYEFTQELLESLKKPGIYRVGGLGACTLISKKAIERGVNYNRVKNLPSDMILEDRDFCVRAEVLGLELWCSTRLKIKHLEKEEFLLEGIEC